MRSPTKRCQTASTGWPCWVVTLKTMPRATKTRTCSPTSRKIQVLAPNSHPNRKKICTPHRCEKQPHLPSLARHPHRRHLNFLAHARTWTMSSWRRRQRRRQTVKVRWVPKTIPRLRRLLAGEKVARSNSHPLWSFESEKRIRISNSQTWPFAKGLDYFKNNETREASQKDDDLHIKFVMNTANSTQTDRQTEPLLH